MDQMKLNGIIDGIIFHNEDNGYSVFTITADEAQITCVGEIGDLHEGEEIEVDGNYVVHPVYGEQFSVSHYLKKLPTTTSGIERYLSSGVINGIGPKLAKKIVVKFGDDTLNVIEQTPEMLAQIKGISKQKALKIADDYNKQIEMKHVMLALGQYNISFNLALRIYKVYKHKAIDILKTNPYKLAEDIQGVGFKTADNLAEEMGVDRLSIFRIKAGVKFALNQWVLAGHTYAPKKELTQYCAQLLDAPGTLIHEAYIELQMESQIKQVNLGEEDALYLAPFYYAENNSAKKIAALAFESEQPTPAEVEGVLARLEALEEKDGVKLADRQMEAVKEAYKNGVMVITGGPGTGKTTVINAIIHIFEDMDMEVVLAAPTGRAAKRMTKTTGRDAQTIHRLLQGGGNAAGGYITEFVKDEDNPIDGDVIIIDEVSMVDILLLYSLLKAIPVGARLILVGDADQLPSVGAGHVLKDIIISGCVKVVTLNEVFRQAQESDIVMNAHRINHGAYPRWNDSGTDFYMIKKATPDEIVATILELLTKRLPGFLKIDGVWDYQVLTPMRKSPLGIYNLNVILQRQLNPQDQSKAEKEFRDCVFRVGDKVTQIKNNYNISWIIKNENGIKVNEGKGVFNGDGGLIEDIDNAGETLTVVFDDGKIVQYDYSQLEELELAYAVTIHKSQGSEYPVVIIPLHSGPPMLMTRNLLYTAVTRAKRLVVLVGSEQMVKKMIDNDRVVSRYSLLKSSIVRMFELYQI